MRVFVYEFVTGGGFLSSIQPAKSLLREGLAMAIALAEDVAALPDSEVVLLRDHRLDVGAPPLGGLACEDGLLRPGHQQVQIAEVESVEEELQVFCAQAAAADWTVVIAPEFDGHLLDRARLVEECNGRLLGPTPELIALGSNKQATADHFARCRLGTPNGELFTKASRQSHLRFPLMLKPVDGAGSTGVQLVRHGQELPASHEGVYRIEEYHAGTAASVAVLRGPNATLVLPACEQRLADGGSFTYLGGTVPLVESLRRRAESLALAAAESLPPWVGYVGFDMVLGEATADDVIIEVNPRLTTSYVGLRRLSAQNLAKTMIDLAEGGTPQLCFDDGPIEFSADGTILASSRQT